MADVIPHGTHGGYTNHRCRCDDCREAHRVGHAASVARMRQRLASGEAQPVHGTPGAYCNWGCRCIPCTQAQAQAKARWRAARAVAL